VDCQYLDGINSYFFLLPISYFVFDERFSRGAVAGTLIAVLGVRSASKENVTIMVSLAQKKMLPNKFP
jgi:hypothetical protein